MANTPESNIPWWAIILGFVFFWPAGLVLLLLNMGGVSLPFEKLGQFTAQTPPLQQNDPAARRTTRYVYAPRQGKPAAQNEPGRRWKQPRLGKLMAAAGGVLSFLFGLAFVEKLSFALRYGLLLYAMDCFVPFGFLCAGLFLLCKGVAQTRLARRMKLYQGVIGQKERVFLSDLAEAAGVGEGRVIADLQRMIADGYLPLGYVDRAAGRLILSDQGYERPAPSVERAGAANTADQAILRKIREINSSISDPEMSRKIARIEEITGKILDYQQKDPAKAPQLRRFLSYYLPTTLKILNAYARMDAQGVEGENISAAKRRIEGMMDKVVEGFEKQLDQLFQADAMDITADVDVLERMLERDGLGGGGMTLGL